MGVRSRVSVLRLAIPARSGAPITLLYLFFLVPLISLSGCADGPVPYFVSLNPKMREQWRADEAYAPTLHRQLAEVDALRTGAAGLSPAQQTHWSGELKHILETQENPLLRAASVDALAEFTVPESNEGLRLASKDSDSTVRLAACRAWGIHGGEEAVEHLAETLGSDSDTDVRIAAASELGKFKQPMAYQALGLALQDKDPALQYRAVESLKHASGKDYGNDLAKWQAFAQGQDPGPEYIPTLAERVRSLF